jgi:hypothetical protein
MAVAPSESDLEVVRQCLAATVWGPFFPEWEFHTLFGLTRPEVAAALDSWPRITESADQRRAAGLAMFNLVHYPHHAEDAWDDYISVSRDQVIELLRRWQRVAQKEPFR